MALSAVTTQLSIKCEHDIKSASTGREAWSGGLLVFHLTKAAAVLAFPSIILINNIFSNRPHPQTFLFLTAEASPSGQLQMAS